MKKIINGMFYGSTKTKLFLWTVFIMALAACGCGVMAVAAGSVQFALSAAAMALVALVTSQSVSLDELNRKKKVRKKKGKESKMEITKNDSKKKASGKLENDLDDSSDKDLDSEARLKRNNVYLMGMKEKHVKKLLKEHKVPQAHVMVMIDRFPKMQLEQCPAFMWRTEEHLHFLSLDKEAGEFEVRINNINGILMLAEVEAEPEDEYMPFRCGGFMAKLFAPYLPDYQERTKDGKLCFMKTLFQIVPGICFTNKSMKNVMKILDNVPFVVRDAIAQSVKYDEYFKEVYRYSVLCRNNVYTQQEYYAKTEATLHDLLTAQMATEQFVKSLRDMYRHRLIKQEDVTKYTQLYQQNRNR